jgi:1-acyl-sn-glycerol-3-phosphate acyltransferase
MPAVTRAPLSALGLRLAGWKFVGEVPREKKYIILAVPHTSNWDGLLLVAVARTIGLPMAWMIKGSWFKGPMDRVLRSTGAIPIDRSRSHNMVEQMIDELRRADELALVIPPEGTRGRTEQWKSGFYHIARGAGVPVIPGFLDYGKKEAGLGPAMLMTGDVRADMDRIRAFYAAKAPTGHHHEDFGPIRLKEEGTAA